MGRPPGGDCATAAQFLQDNGRYARNAGKTIKRVSQRTLDHLRAYAWPGNVRELQSVIERSVIVCNGDEFTVDESWLSAARAPEKRPLARSVSSHERQFIQEALRASGGRVYGPSDASARLGIARSTLLVRTVFGDLPWICAHD